MKKTLLVVVLALAVFAGTATAGTKEFWKGGIYITPQFGINSWGGSIPFWRQRRICLDRKYRSGRIRDAQPLERIVLDVDAHQL